ncbi:MAG: Pilus biogenesis CpaD protein [Rhodobacteraceae bacterium HLUCCA12]|nr:MAG: Pilus biogenesis CpaD protein [Rhodobacteraceae bacterium HLUCCA12]
MTAIFSRLRLVPLLALAAFLAACADGRNLGEQRPELGDFRLAHNIVVTENVQVGPFSRQADNEDWEEAIRNAVARRFDRYEGDRLYHIAVSVDGYVLAVPGIPLVASPRSALIVGVHVWDDALGRPLNEERKQLTVMESVSGGTVLGSGLTQTAEEQMQNLATNAALQIENWLADNPQWFNTAEGDAAAEDETEADEDSAEDTDSAALEEEEERIDPVPDTEDAPVND